MSSSVPAPSTSGRPHRAESGSVAQRERRKRILDATIILAASGGFEAVQMRAVAEHADVALGTLYRYFPSKIHLLVSAMDRELERANRSMSAADAVGVTPADRVINALKRISRGLEGDQNITEALTRAFMFADSSAREEISAVGGRLNDILANAIHPGSMELTDEEAVIVRVIGDVWLSTLVAWVTGRIEPYETAQHMERAVRLVLP